jgi:ABC-type multidrug transport system fused ATPase/permease subunit
MTLSSFEALQPLPSAAQMLSSSLPAARRLFEVVDTPDDYIERREPRIVTQGFISTPLLQISGLTFTYPGFEIPVLKDVSFDLTPGKKIALVGPSAAGKSTLINLLLRFWNAPPGSIQLDRRDLLDFSDEAARQAFSVISQRTYLFNASIRENLLLADPEANRGAIEQAARQAGIHGFISNLREGYETIAGERGQRLSGGERQRLAIARALLRNAPIFLLDEPISNLDVLTGRVILENILRLTRDRSLLLVTHCLIGMEHMDEILVLDKGSIIERGGHETLMQNGGLYRQMVDLQSRILGESL